MKIIKRSIRHTLSMLFSVFADLSGSGILLFLYIIKPIKFIKLCQLRVERIGHLAGNTDLFLRRLQLKKNNPGIFYIGIADSKAANKQLLKMFRREFFIIQNALVFKVLSSSNILKKSIFYEILLFKTNEYYEFNNTQLNLYFTPSEENKGKNLLNELGINSWFACFHSRDPAYLYDKFPSGDWSYHDHRDSDVRNYLKAADYIASSGGFALRTGDVVAEKLPDLNNPHIIDYATSHRTDFGDIYLLAKCKFFLGNTAGLFDLATIFHVPVAMANLIPIIYPPLRKGDLFIPKKLWSIEKNRFLTFREILESEIAGYASSEQYKKAGLVIVENTAEEILDLAIEMNECLDGLFEYTEEDEELQNRFRSLIKPYHHFYGTPARIGARFLRENKELLR